MNKQTTNPKRNLVRDIVTTIGIAACSLLCFTILTGGGYNTDSSPSFAEAEVEIPQTKYGFDIYSHAIESSKIKSNQFLGDILTSHGISYQTIADLETKAKEVFDVRNIRAGKPFHIVKKDSCDSECLAFVYEPSPLRYVLYDFRDSVNVQIIENDYEMRVETASGEITSSLWQSMVDQDINPGVIDLMEDALASSVSFYHTKTGDQYKVIYEQKYIDDEPVSLGRILGAYYKNTYGEYYSVYYENEAYSGFYDMEGRPSKKSFLKSPIKGGSRISSRYNIRRMHPIKKRTIPHLGTDYAAPHGTPIQAVSNGVITKVSRTRGNGNYVKMKHDDTYETQYLHMQRFAKGIKPGVQVQQGDIIGYVGSTGLATGPHVCFRFWKNKKQIDFLREKFPPAEPMDESEMPKFINLRDSIKVQLDIIDFTSKTIDIEGEASLAL